jgi:hypothetical protein
MQDSKAPGQGVLTMPATAFAVMLRAAKSGHLDELA